MLHCHCLKRNSVFQKNKFLSSINTATPGVSYRRLSRNSAIAKAIRDTKQLETSFQYGAQNAHIRVGGRDASDIRKSRPNSPALRSQKFDSSRSIIASNSSRERRPRRLFGRTQDEGPGNTLVSVPLTTAASTFVIGIQSVVAALKSGRRKLYKLYLEEQPQDLEIGKSTTKENHYDQIQSLCTRLGVPIGRVSRHFINSALIKHASENSRGQIHDGVLLEASPLPQLAVESLTSWSKFGNHFSFELGRQSAEDEAVNGSSDRLIYNDAKRRNPFILWLHGTVDTRNVGALYRTALYFGVDAIILTSRGTASLLAVTTKVSAGATEFMQTLTVDSPERFMKDSQRHGWMFYAAVAPSSKHTRIVTLDAIGSGIVRRHPCVLILGNENDGLPYGLVRLANEKISIQPYSGLATEAGLDSLNVSVAGALLCERFLQPPVSESLRASRDQEDEDRLF